MPIVIVTPGATDANSYCTVAEADAYHTNHLYASAWTGSGLTTKERALITATRLLDEEYAWEGWVVSTTQALEWPRTGALKRSGLAYEEDDQIPLAVQHATAELARVLIEMEQLPNQPTIVPSQVPAGVSSLSVGSVSLAFSPGSVPTERPPVPMQVYAMISWLVESVRGLSGMRDLKRA